MFKQRAHPACTRLKPVKPQERIEPDQPTAGTVQPVRLDRQFLDGIALKPVRDQKHHGALPQHPARPEPVEHMQRLADAGAAGPVPDSTRDLVDGLIRILRPHLPRNVGEPRAKQEGVNPAPLLSDRMHEMQEDARVLAHGARNIGDDHQWRLDHARFAEARQDEAAAGAHGSAHGCARIDADRMVGRAETPRPDFIEGEFKVCDGTLGCREFRCRHLREILRAQDLVAGTRLACVNLDNRLFFRRASLVMALEKRFGNAGFAGLHLFLFAVRGRDRREHRDHLFNEITGAPEQPERLVENLVVLATFHKHGMERPVEFLTAADAGDPHRFNRVARAGRTNLQPCLAQDAREIDDVVGDFSVALAKHDGIAALIHGQPRRSSDFTSSSTFWPSLPLIRAISS